MNIKFYLEVCTETILPFYLFFSVKSRILFGGCEMRCQQLITGSWDLKVCLVRVKIEEKRVFVVVYLFDYDENWKDFSRA